MSARHQAREWAIQFLFQRDFHQEDLEQAIVDFWEDKKPQAQARAFADDLIRGVEAHREAIDEQLQKYADNWDVKRMGVLDRTVLRLAVHEMMHRTDIPPVVSINEAVTLAKEFSSNESGRFVNGILDRIRKDLDRPARSAARDEGDSP